MWNSQHRQTVHFPFPAIMHAPSTFFNAVISLALLSHGFRNVHDLKMYQCFMFIFRPGSIDWLFLGPSCMFMKWETENNFKKMEFFLSNYCILMQIFASFSFYFYFYLTTLSNGSVKDPRNNKSIESGLIAIICWLS